MNFDVPIPFVDLLGFELTRCESGEATILYAPRPEHLNSFAMTHGGALMSLLDVVMASAARSLRPEMGMITIEMKTSFMRPARGALRSEGRLLHHTRTMAFVEASVFDTDDQRCAHATGTFKYMPRRPADAGAAASIPTD